MSGPPLPLRTVNFIGSSPISHCVQMLDWFSFCGHVCISFELLSVSTFDFLKANNFLPYPVNQIRHMAQQICHAVSCESSMRRFAFPSPSPRNTVSDDSKLIIYRRPTEAAIKGSFKTQFYLRVCSKESVTGQKWGLLLSSI